MITKKIKEADYYVSEDGKVYNKKGKQLSTWIGNTGYLKVKIRINKNKKDRYVHRLVAEAWVPNPNNYPQVMHKDDNKNNPHKDNLEWGTNSQNTKSGYDNSCYQYKERSHRIKAVHKITGVITYYKSIRELDEKLGYNRKTVTSILKGTKVNNFEHDFYYDM